MATASNVQLNCSLEDYFNETHDLESDSKVAKVVKSSTSHFLVLVCDPIPHPSNVELALNSHTFVTNHTLDMNFSYLDEKYVLRSNFGYGESITLLFIHQRMCQFFGYTMEDFKYRSAYEFHHAQDNESILKSYKTSE
jgi:hypoxia-inducible factor 1 alpha